jgi:protein O-mannosyl-transferase
MMSLSSSQKKYIKKKLAKMTVEEMAKSLGVGAEEIENYLKRENKVAKKVVGKEEKDLKAKMAGFFWKVFVKDNWKILVSLAVLVLVIYANGLSSEFVSDDIGGIVQSKIIDDLGSIFSSPMGVFKFFQPTVQFLVKAVFGMSPVAFRMINVLLHMGVVSLVFILVTILYEKRAGVLAGILVAVHPLLVESVTWISGGGYVMYSFFLLLSLFLYLLSLREKKYFYWSFMPFLLALSVSEKAVIYPVILFFLMVCFRLGKAEYKKLLILFVPAGVVGLVFLSMLGDRLSWLRADYYHEGGFVSPWQVVLVAISSYLGLIFWPDKLTLYHSEMVFSKFQFWLMTLTLFAFLGLIIYLWIKKRKWSFWPIMFFVSLMPTMTPFGVSWLVAERYVYLGTVAILVLVALVLNKLLENKKWQGITIIFLVFAILGLVVRTVVRNGNWKNQDTLWLSAVRTSPSSHQNHNNLGDYYARQGDYEKAVEEFSMAIELKEGYADAFHNRANVYAILGRLDEALEGYQTALKYNPKLWQSEERLAAVYFEKGEWRLSEEHINKAIELGPGVLDLRVARAIILQNGGKEEEAKKELELILKYDPGNEKVKKMLEDLSSF